MLTIAIYDMTLKGATESMGHQREARESRRKGFGLQARMTISYIAVAVLNVMLLELLALLALFFIVSRLGFLSTTGRTPDGNTFPNFFGILEAVLITGLFWLVVMAPAGALFGVMFTRGLVRRIHRLVQATTRFAEGDYTQRVSVAKRDEVGQLERQFNTMAEQLVESIRKQRELVEYHARIE